MQTEIRDMLKAKTTIGDGEVMGVSGYDRNYQLKVSGTGTVSATATVYGSLFETGPWEPMITLSASGSGPASDIGETHRKWRYTYARLTAISGAGATADLRMEV